MSVGLSESQAKVYIDQAASARNTKDVTIACVNSNRNVTLSGDKTRIEELKQRFDDDNVFARVLNINVAYHSPHMDAIAFDYANSIRNLEARRDSLCCRMISSVTGNAVARSELSSAAYWVANMVSRVRFSDAMKQICDESARQARKKLDCSHRDHLCVNMLIEVGPHSALQGSIRDNLGEVSAKTIRYSSTLTRNCEATNTFLTMLGKIHCLGYPVDVGSVNRLATDSDPSPMTDLPEYPFDKSQVHWQESRISERYRTHPSGKLDLLGKAVPDWNPMEAKWRNFIKVSDMPWVEDHIVSETVQFNHLALADLSR